MAEKVSSKILELDGVLTAGVVAPEFALQSGPGEVVSLRALRGRPVVLTFYPADWSPVCGDQMSLYNEILPELAEFNAHLLGISVDGPWCHDAYRAARKLKFQLLADFEPKGAVSRLYGAYDDAEGTSERALFVIDPNGVIQWSYLSPIDINPGADGMLAALESIAKSEPRP